jgi:hypothetical protein
MIMAVKGSIRAWYRVQLQKVKKEAAATLRGEKVNHNPILRVVITPEEESLASKLSKK